MCPKDRKGGVNNLAQSAMWEGRRLVAGGCEVCGLLSFRRFSFGFLLEQGTADVAVQSVLGVLVLALGTDHWGRTGLVCCCRGLFRSLYTDTGKGEGTEVEHRVGAVRCLDLGHAAAEYQSGGYQSPQW